MPNLVVAAFDDGVRIFDAVKGMEVCSIVPIKDVRTLTFDHATSRVICGAADGKVYVCDLKSRRIVQEYAALDGGVCCVLLGVEDVVFVAGKGSDGRGIKILTR